MQSQSKRGVMSCVEALRALTVRPSSSSRVVMPMLNSLTRTVATEATAPTPTLKPLLPPLDLTTDRLSNLPTHTDGAVSLIQSSSTPSKGRYVIARLHNRNFLLHPKDILTVPTLKQRPPVGTLLGLNRIIEVGARDYSLKAPEPIKDYFFKGRGGAGLVGERPVLPGTLVRCNLTVLEHTVSPMEYKLKKKRRTNYEKTIKHKQGWTRLRVGDIHVGTEASSSA